MSVFWQRFILDAPYRWPALVPPKTPDGAFHHNTALTGPDLIGFVNEKLFPYLRGFRTRAESGNTIEYKIGEIFSEIGKIRRMGNAGRNGG